MSRSRAPLWPWFFAGLLVTALLALAFLQHHWLTRVSEAEAERVRAQIEQGTAALAAEVNGELARLALDLAPHGPPVLTSEFESTEKLAETLARQLERWRLTTDHPDLIASLWTAEAADLDLFRFEETRRAFVAVPAWPAEWQDLRRDLGHPATWRPAPLDPRLPALVLPFGLRLAGFVGRPVAAEGPPEPNSRPPRPESLSAPPAPVVPPVPPVAPSPAAAPRPPSPLVRQIGEARLVALAPGPGLNTGRFLIVHLEVRALADLVARSAARDLPDPDLDLRLFDAGGREVWRQGRPAPAAARLEKSVDLLSMLQFNRPSRPDILLLDRRMAWTPEAAAHGWRLEVRHSAGSLEAAAARSRRQNLALSSAILALIAASLIFLATMVRRARQAAQQQLELVAGITHELLTPLAALRSAGQNLEDGIVREPERVGRYGRLIVTESQRLADLVQQALAFAGLEGRSLRLEKAPCGARTLVEEALEELKVALEGAHAQVELDCPAPQPRVLADPQAVRRVLVNLIGNGLKHGRSADGIPRLEIRIRPAAPTVAIAVRDRGPGLDPEDLPRLFAPFVRGKKVVASAVAGAGLGLALARRLAEAGGGRLEAAAADGDGALFTLTLPGAEP